MYAYLTGNNKLHDVSYNWSHNIKFVTIIFFYLIYNLNFLVPFSLALFYWSIHNLVDEMTGAQQNIIWQMTVALGEAGYGVAWWELQLHAGYYFEIKYECWEFLKNSAKTQQKRLCVRQATYIMRRVVYTNWTAINAMFRGHARFVNSVRSRSYNLNNWPIKSNLPLLQGGNERLGKLDIWRGKEKWAFKTKI